MHRQRNLPILRCRPSQVRYAATAAKQKPVTWQEPENSGHTGTHSKWSRSTDTGAPPSGGFINPANIRWANRGQASSPKSSFENSSGFADVLKKFPRDYPTSTSLPSKSNSNRTPPGPRRWAQKLSLDPPSSGLNKWSLPQPQEDQQQRVRGNTLDSPALPMPMRRTFDFLPSQLRQDREPSRRQRLGKAQSGWSPPEVSEKFEVAEEVDNTGLRKMPRSSVRLGRDPFKARGSLITRIKEDAVIPKPTRSTPSRSNIFVTGPRKEKRPQQKNVTSDVFIPSTVSVGTLARLLNIRLDRLQRKMAQAGMEKEASYDHVLTSDYAVLLAEEFGRNPVVNDEAAFDIHPAPPHPNHSSNPSRPPIVTIMGHVDHGKTTLLDTLRSSSVAKGEVGGITQHIGAFSVSVPGSVSSASGSQTITFLDTPGHAAFSAMRARGASVTDIVVLVVAADDGIMPQTREVIELVKKDQDKVGLVVAINKVDKPGVDVENVKRALLSEGIQLEWFGGDIPCVEVSGLTGHGLNDLVETLSAMAELQDLRAEREGPVHGYILESKIHKGLGSVATVLVLRGCLTVGSHILSGTSHAKVRVMNNSSGDAIKTAYPGMAVTVSGWKILPSAGDEVLQGSEPDVKKAVANRVRKAEMQSTLIDVEAINNQRRQEREKREQPGGIRQATSEEPSQGPKELRLVIKGDVSGSVEAVAGAVEGIGNKQAVVKVVSTGVGDVSESDVMMAKATEGMVVAFSVTTPRSVEAIASQNSVSICSSSIIYRLMDDIKQRVIALLPVIKETKVTGEATVLQLFDIHLKAKQIKKVAGCRVINGILEKARNARVIRNGTAVHQGMFDTLRHVRKDTTEVRKGLECGLSFENFDGLREGDLIQVYQEIEKPGVL